MRVLAESWGGEEGVSWDGERGWREGRTSSCGVLERALVGWGFGRVGHLELREEGEREGRKRTCWKKILTAKSLAGVGREPPGLKA